MAEHDLTDSGISRAFEAAGRTFWHFVCLFWPTVHPGVEMESGGGSWILESLAGHLQAMYEGKASNRLMVMLPPRTGKTTVVSVLWPAWLWVKNPNISFLYATYAIDVGRESADACLSLIQHPAYQAFCQYFNRNISVSKVASSGERFILQDETGRLCGSRVLISVGGQTTGYGGDWLILDDPHNAHQVDQIGYLESCWRWWNRGFLSRWNDASRGGLILIGQRTHPDDIFGRLLSQKDVEKSWDIVRVPMEYTGPYTPSLGRYRWRDPRTRQGQSLSNRRWPKDYIRTLKQDSRTWLLQYQQEGSDQTDELGFDVQSWQNGGSPEPELLRRLDGCIAIDSGIVSGSGDSSYSCLIVAGADRSNRVLYILDVVRARLDGPDLERVLLDRLERWSGAGLGRDTGGIRVILEASPSGRTLAQYWRQKLELADRIVEVNPQTSKFSRLALARTMLAGWTVITDRSASWFHDFAEELSAPARSRHLDQVDAMVWLVLYICGCTMDTIQKFRRAFERCAPLMLEAVAEQRAWSVI